MFIGTLIGGFVAAAIAKRRGPVLALAIIFFVLDIAIATAHATMARPVPQRDPSQFTISEAANFAIQPVWYDFAIPFAAAAGVLTGGRRRRALPQELGEATS